jgi:hypothetical protein
LTELQDLLDAYGGDPNAWPASGRAAAERLIAADPAAMAAWQRARRFDAMLASGVAMSSEVAAESVLATLAARPLPRQRQRWWAWPAPLLDLDFSPAWPRVAALACVGLLGFAVGLVGLDRVAPTGAATAIADAGLSVVAFEPEPLTGVRP